MATGKAVKKGGSTIFWIIGGLVVIAGGIGAYFLLRKPKEEDDKRKDDDSEEEITSGGDRYSQPQKIPAPKELNTKDKIKSFQNYVVNVKKDRAILGNSGVDGIWGKDSQAAWNKYGSDYNKSLTSVPSTPENESKIATIILLAKKGSPRATKQYLDKANKGYVDLWAKNLLTKKTSFMWANQYYRTDTGVPILTYNPKLLNFTAKEGAKLRENPSTKAKIKETVKQNTQLGKGREVVFADPNVWIYFEWLPQGNPIRRTGWIASQNVSRIKSSSFSGVTDELEFLNFDNNLDLNF